MTSDQRDDWRTAQTDALFEAILTLRTVDEAARFFRDLCTHKELTDLGHRWAITRLLDGGLPYREIAAEVGGSTATITRINQWLQHGMGGYRLVLDRMKAQGQP